MKKVVKFPKQICWAKEHPLVSFYRKSLLNAKKYWDVDRFTVDVTKFSIHPDDEKILITFIEKAAKKERPGITKKYLQSTVAMELLCNGPRTDASINPGTVEIDFKDCFVCKKESECY